MHIVCGFISDILCKSDIHFTCFFYIYFFLPYSINDNFLYLTWCGVRVTFWIKENIFRKGNISQSVKKLSCELHGKT